MRAAVVERFRRVLSFHSRVNEAEVMAAAVPVMARRLAEGDPGAYPPVEQVWADWLYGEHAPGHRHRVLDEFASEFLGGPDFEGRNVRAELRVLSSVRVLGEGVDTAECDAVLFADVRGSMVDIVQMVGRALRLHPEHGKLATLVVPVFLGPGEDPNELLTSDAYNSLSKVLGALRAHDAETIEALADPRLRNGRPAVEAGEDGGLADVDGDGFGAVEGQALVSERAAGVLRFSEERDPAVLTQFVRLRVIDPEGAYWRRGIEAATRWLRETGSTELRVPFTYVTPQDWPGVGSHPLGVFVADQRKYYAAGTLEASRVAELEQLGMVWSVHASAFDAGLEVARSYAAVHGHFLPPASAVWGGDGFLIGVWAKNQRAAARKSRENAVRRAAGESGVSGAGELSQARMDALDEIDPGWCPAWEIGWQRCYRLALAHVQAGGALPAGAERSSSRATTWGPGSPGNAPGGIGSFRPSSGFWNPSGSILTKVARRLGRYGAPRTRSGSRTSLRPASSTPAKATYVSHASTARKSMGSSSGWARSSPMPDAGRRSSAPSAGLGSMPSVCAGSRS